ncbi:MAG TPA: TIR domain-containing protein [Anaerolineales bacterium]|nr:TIR domain-containing protein [Anaerolineales bacterium]
MGRVFISYSRRDTEIVDSIVQAMKQAGLDVWIDRQDIQAGNTWRVQIVQAIDTCTAFVLMLSPSSAASDNVRKEIDLAQDSGRMIFPIMLEPVRLPAEIRYQLAGLQFINVQMLGLEKAVHQLISTVSAQVDKERSLEEQKTRQAELVIQGIDLASFDDDKQEQLLGFLAQLVNTNRSELKIAGLAAGSVHVFVDLPTEDAFELKTLALNRDKRFKKFGIIAFRLATDKKFINIALGVLTATATIGVLQTFWLSVPSLLPVFGVATGKILTLLLAAGVIAGLSLSIPTVVAPLVVPSPTPAPTATSTLTPTSTATASQTLTPTETPTPHPQAPIIDRVEPRKDMSSGNLTVVEARFYFRDADGDAHGYQHRVISISPGAEWNMIDGSFDPSPEQKEGTFTTATWTYTCGSDPFEVTMEVTIFDQAGHTSNPVRYTMFCN